MTKTALEVAYQSLIARKRLRPDKHQHALVTRLATLQQDLVRIYGDENDHDNNKNKKKNGMIRNSHQHISTYFPNPRGLYIYGSVGTGKSHLADLFTSTLPSHIPRQRLHFHEFLNSIHYRLHLARSSSPSSSPYKGDPLVQIGHEIVHHEARVLCFDEFQLTDIADAMILQRLFGAMWMAGGVLVSTSNRAPRDLYLNGLNREVVVPFLREVERWCEVWEMGGREDYRMAGEGGGDGNGEGDKGRIQTFFVNDEEGFTRKLEEEIAKVRRGGSGDGDGDDAKDPLELISLPVYGSRTLQVSALPSPSPLHQKSSTSYTLITATFSQLCESPLSASDYHTLCTATSHLYLHGVRKFLAGEKDAVRRFITLIDVAYEKGTRVICSYGNDEESDGKKSSLVESLREVFENIVPSASMMGGEKEDEKGIKMTVRAGGGASSSMMSTFIGETEWSATGLAEASLATGGAGETDVGFAVGRAISRLYEMGSVRYGVRE